MPEVQIYTTGSKTSELYEATGTVSGTKAYLDVNVGQIATATQDIVNNDFLICALNEIKTELKIMNLHLEKLSELDVKSEDINL